MRLPACLRAARGQLAGGSSDCSRLTLRFVNGRTEAGFLASRKEPLAKRARTLCYVLLTFGGSVLIFHLLVLKAHLPESYGNDVQYQLGRMSLLCISVQMILSLLLLAFLSSLTDNLPTLALEAIGNVFVILTVVSGVFSTGDRLGQLSGFNLKEVFGPDAHHSDSFALMILVCSNSAVHLGLPVRWCTLVPFEIVSLLTYVAVISSIGSHENEQNRGFLLAMLFTFVITTSIGKRAMEQGEREAFLSIINEKQLRCSAEFQLSQVSQAQPRQRPRSIGESCETLSLPTTAPSGQVFEFDMDGIQNLRDGLTRIADMGDAEHWRIPASEVDVLDETALGTGASGVVRRGSFCGMMVAVKRPRNNLNETSVPNLPALCNELRILRRLKHQNIVSVYGAVVEPRESKIALILELVRGRKLSVYMKELAERQSQEEQYLLPKFRISMGVCRALLYMHSRYPRVVHGDLKTDNIMLEEIGEVVTPKLLDFGLSRVLTQKAGRLGGTLAWMAPEVFAGDGPAKRSADVYSFGRLLAFVATAIPPLRGLDRSQIKTALKDRRPPHVCWPPDCAFSSTSCRPLVDACLQAVEERRPSIFEVHKVLLGLPQEVRIADAPGGFVEEVQALAAQARDSEARRSAVAASALLGAQGAPPAPLTEQTTTARSILPTVNEAAQEEEEEEDDDDEGKEEMKKEQQERLQQQHMAVEVVQPDERVQPQETWRLVPELSRTSPAAMHFALLEAFAQWNYELPGPPCCDLHGALEAARVAIADCETARCICFPPPSGQCRTCGLFTAASQEESARCGFCSGRGSGYHTRKSL